MIKILKIREHSNMAVPAAEWFHQKWQIPLKTYQDSICECLKNKTMIPQWYLAMDQDAIVGGLGVIENDFHNRKDLKPNVCALYVEKNYRCQGIAGTLLQYVCNDMKELGIDTLYLITDHTSFYERYHWKFLCMVQGEGETNMTRMYIYNNRIENILKYWAIDAITYKEIQEFVWNINDSFFLKKYADLNEGRKVSQITDQLLKYNVPVAKPVKTLTNKNYTEIDGAIYILSEKLPGKQIDHDSLNDTFFIEMGKVIAQLHCVFAKIETEIELWDNNLLDELQGWIKDTLQDNGWSLISENEYSHTLYHLKKYDKDLPKQLIHRDVHLNNFLFYNGNFSGYIDFDLSQRNIRIFDLCYFLTGLLCEEEKITLTDNEWKNAVKNTVKGYHEIINLTEAEQKAIPFVMEAIELLFAAWFTIEKNNSSAKDAAKIYHYIVENS